MEHCRNFAGLQKFRNLPNAFPTAIVHLHATVHLSCCFTLFPFYYNFFFLPILSIVIAFDFGSFCIFAWLGQYISSCTVIKDNFCSVIKLAGSFQLSHFFSFSPIFSHFLSTFSLAKHPPRMKTRRMSGYNLLLLEVEGHWAQDLEQSKEFPIFHASTHCHLCSPFTLGLDPFDSC